MSNEPIASRRVSQRPNRPAPKAPGSQPPHDPSTTVNTEPRTARPLPTVPALPTVTVEDATVEDASTSPVMESPPREAPPVVPTSTNDEMSKTSSSSTLVARPPPPHPENISPTLTRSTAPPSRPPPAAPPPLNPIQEQELAKKEHPAPLEWKDFAVEKEESEDSTESAEPEMPNIAVSGDGDSESSSEVRKAGRRMAPKGNLLVKTTRTIALPHARSPSAGNLPNKTSPPVPNKEASDLNDQEQSEAQDLTAADFVWGKRSASMSSVHSTDGSENTSDGVPSSTKSANRSFAIPSSGTFRNRKPSFANADAEAAAMAASSANQRDSAAIVVKLGLNPPLTETPEMMKTRGNLADEILKTEAVYLEDLRMIVSKFLIPIRGNLKIVSATEAAKLFLNIESLEMISEEILECLKLAFLQSPSSSQVNIAPVYLQFTDTMLQGFSLYCSGHSESLTLLSKLRRKIPAFSAFLDQLEADEALNRLKLADMLTRPIQHICRQPLLLRELLKSTPATHPDFEQLIFALDKINDIVDKINSNAKEVGNIQAIMNVESSVSDLPPGLKLLMPGRYMLREGRFLKVSRKMGKLPVEQYIFLFSDMLILTKPKSFGSDGEYIFMELLPLHQVFIEDQEDSNDHKNAFAVTSLLTLRSHMFVAKDQQKNNEIIKRDWLNAISSTKAKFEKGLAGQFDDDTGIAFKVQGSESLLNPYEVLKDQLASVSVQSRIVGWKGEDILKEIAASAPSSTSTPTHPAITKFHMEAPAAVKIVGNDQTEIIENEAEIFVFDEFVVMASERKDVQVKKPYEWLDSVIYSSCVLANMEGPQQEKKIYGGRNCYPISLISAASRKKFVLYFRSETVKNNMFQILSKRMPSFMDNGAAGGVSTSFVAHKRDKSNDDDKSSTLRTKKNIFGKKLGYRTTSQSTTTTPTASPQTPTSSSSQSEDIRTQRSLSSAVIMGGQPTPLVGVYGAMNGLSHHSSFNSPGPVALPSPIAEEDDREDVPEKQLTAEGFEVPPWAPDDSSNVCLGCDAKFSGTNRRHHCRNCGQLFCKKCTTKKCFLPRFGFTQKKVRVCERCFLKH